MVKQADSGAWSFFAAVAAAIAPAVVKAILSRRSRAPIKLGEQAMCKNHSHATGTLISARNKGEYTEVEMLVEQPLTLEFLNGGQLMLPPFTVLLLRQDHPGVSPDKVPQATVALEDLPLFRGGLNNTSGLTTQQK
jgi:hypothetical protein